MIHKKYVLLLVAAILVASLAVTGCSKKAPILKPPTNTDWYSERLSRQEIFLIPK